MKENENDDVTSKSQAAGTSHHSLSLPFSPTVLSQQVIKRWEERERDKEKECDMSHLQGEVTANETSLGSLLCGYLLNLF